MDTLRQCEDVCPKSAYEKVGTRITSAALAQKLLRDKEFYTVSGGGVTFSGGEAGLQADFVYETAKLLLQGRCSCNFRYRRTDQMGHFIPFVRRNRSCPIRHQIHRRTDSQKCTGVSNQLILDNAKDCRYPQTNVDPNGSGTRLER